MVINKKFNYQYKDSKKVLKNLGLQSPSAKGFTPMILNHLTNCFKL